MTALTLISHPLCPYVQRAAIVLAEKGLPHERIEVDLAAKPAWFLALSPLGKTPVLLADGEAVFESAVICEYLDETAPPRLHPADPLARARERAWMEFGSAVLNGIATLYNAADAAAFGAASAALRQRFETLESALASRPGAGDWFAGDRFGLVDAVFGPVFRYFEVIPPDGLFEGLPHLQAWRGALAARPSVRDAVGPGYAALLRAFLGRRGSALSRRLATMAA